ncbi:MULTISPECIES: DNA gyrase inhibitor YacG [Pseudonocardia]|uniref:DNA gyrase inhibitor YacG n=3 Tax=Pseudonocardia TaxID=1847 RepID=A0A1Y2MIU2_PSEAH|nr:MULTISPECIES: DNA gyrase inhibitor YacG [Pseudonocardia]OSY34378.1 DNA gyrase inhibitor YacG [Pseudonocardia autotrophica]TDN72089.1 uncharacterized protein DUF329 [Pseudonocardia autotrophica]TDN74588.1 uncharacterized protein DUF329 [Pseudonocardia autotrophica]TDN77204.1 uncharacterized protein DUF329 [Pseudonocardia autotrophica]BBG01219.1 hypothetical protein Pdca_24280 [Pseudonocardia autotrophica]
MTILGEHPCPACGRQVTVTRRNPNRRFCSSRCRAAHHRDHPHTAPDVVPDAVPGSFNTANAVTRDALTSPNGDHAVPDAVPNAVPPGHAVPAANGVQRCPHCRTELAVITVVVPAGAAHIRTPEVTHMTPT